MAKRPDYDIGTVTLTSGSSDFTTTGSALQTAAVQAGDAIISPSGNVLIIASITGQNSGTLFLPCPAAAAGTGLPLRIRFQPDGSRYQGAVRNLIDLLSSGNVEAFAALVGSSGMVPIFTGVGTMDLADPATFGIQDPNGSLGQLAALTLAARQILQTDAAGALKQVTLVANKFLRTDANADLSQGDITALGAALLNLTGTNGNIPVMTGAGSVASRPILGTVAQSGGVPTGAIVERGGSADFGYIRDASGLQICWRVSALYPDVSVAKGNIFGGNSIAFGSFPAAFVSLPSVTVFGTDAGGGGWAAMETYHSTSSFGSYSIRNHKALVGNSQIYAEAIGRWY
ncbi:hypothetical protein QBD01_003664 [Ochrobactrum sp. 19YEA23]|uniref:hypothetical protein n=1 Tax=Ochrobactrum sp. 19YEA23 TaxID=3039854 RepID=UPI002479E7C4|nr:hypothetical protein [Ochrobactrum sp. 19YEA23]